MLSVVCGLGIAAALTADSHAPAAARTAPAADKVPAAAKIPAADKARGADKARAADRAPAADKAQAPLGAVRSHGHLLGLVAPLSARQRGAADRGGDWRSGLAVRSLAGHVTGAVRSRKAGVMESALLDPKVVVGTQPTGVAVSATKAYVANQGSNSVSVIDLTQNPPVVVATVAVGSQPDAVALSANGARLYAANFGGGTVNVIDTATNAVTKTVAVGSRPTGIVEVGGLVYVANLSSHSVSVFDPALAAPTATSFTVPATGVTLSAPSGLAASANGQRLYVNDARNGTTFVFDLTQNPPVSTGSVVNGAGTFPAYLAVSGTTGFSANPGTNSIRVLDLTALTAANVPVGSSPYGVVALPSLGQAFAANSGSDDLTVIDTAAATPTALAPTVATGDVPDAIAVSPDQQTAVVSNEGEGTVSIFHVNQPPQNTVPGAQSIVYNATAAVHHTIVFSTAAGKQISTSDADAAASALKVTLSVAHGTLTLAQTTNLTFLSGANGQASMTFTGLQADVNAALNGLAYEPTSVFFGSDALALTVDDQGSTGLGKPQSTSSSVAISVTDTAPTDIALSPASVNENQPVATTVGSFSTTDPDAGDVFSYSLVTGAGSTDNGSFQLVGNTLQTNAIFNFEAKSSYAIRVRSADAGGLFFEKALTVTINNVNETPVNTVPGTQTVNEDTDLTFSAGTALSIADVDAGGGTIKLSLDVAHGTLTLASTAGLTFVDGTANATASVHVTGTLANINADLAGLKYRGTANWNSTRGSETLTMITNDQGNSGSGGALSDTDTVGITVSAVNDAPTATTHSYSAQANMKITGLTGLLSGASDPDTGDGGYTATFTVGTVGATSPAGGTISNLNTSAGSFDFDPPAGAAGAVTFTYTVCDSGNPGPSACSAATTVTVNVSGPVIWFVNSAAATNGTGTLTSPFNVLSSADAVDAANQGIFLYSSATNYTGALTLNTGEKLIGQGTTGTTFDSVFGIAPPAGTVARPTLGSGTATLTGTLTLAGSTTLRGLALSTGTSNGLVGSGGISGVDLDQVSVTTSTGTAVNLNNAAGGYGFSSVSTNGAANGILLDTLGTSNVTVGGGSIVNASTRGIDINSGTGNFTYTGAISTTATGRSVEITSHTGGTITLSGAISDTGTGINLTGNTGATINFSGGITASTGANAAFNATGGGTVSATQNNTTIVNTLTTGTGTALTVTGTTIGGSGLTFRSISSNNAASGIVLTTTGSSGGLTVTGNAGTCSSAATCTGGAIQNSTGPGILLTSVGGAVSLTRMSVNNGGDDGIRGSTVSGGFTLDNSRVTNNGNINGENGIEFTQLTGTSPLTNDAVSSNFDSEVFVTNASGVLNLNVTGGTYSGASGGQGDGIFVEGTGTGSQNLNVQGPITFSNNVGDHVQHSADADNTTDSDVTINNATMTSPPAAGGGPTCALNILGGGIVVSHGGNVVGGSNADVTITNNNIQNSCIGGIAVGTSGSVFDQQIANVDVWIQNNTIGTAGIAGSGSVQGNGIFVDSNGNSNVRALITSNQVRQWTNRNGLDLDVLDGDAAMDATVRGNVFTEPNSAFAGTTTRGMTVQLGSAQVGDSVDVCLDIGHASDATQKNTLTDTGESPQPDVRYLHEGQGSVVQLAGFAGSATQTDITNWFTSRNIFGPTPVVSGIFTNPTGATTSSVVACAQPAN